MKISSVQIGWALAAVILLGFFIPWVRYAPKDAFDNSLQIASQLAADDSQSALVYDYVLVNGRDWRALWRQPGEGVSAYQVTVSGAGGRDGAAAALVEILFGAGGDGWKGRLLLLAPLLGLAGAAALTGHRGRRGWVVALAAAELAFYLFVRWRLRDAYVDRLLLELNWGLWLSLFGLALLAAVQFIRAALPPKVKW
jgi:hypothetical protein